MKNLKIVENFSDGTQQELSVSDVISRLFSEVETICGKEDEDTTYKIERYNDGIWIVRHEHTPYEGDYVEKVINLNDFL